MQSSKPKSVSHAIRRARKASNRRSRAARCFGRPRCGLGIAFAPSRRDMHRIESLEYRAPVMKIRTPGRSRIRSIRVEFFGHSRSFGEHGGVRPDFGMRPPRAAAGGLIWTARLPPLPVRRR